MAAGLADAARVVDEALAAFDPELLSGDDCATAAALLARIEKACAGARVRAAARAAACGVHRRQGFGDPEEWLARLSGSSTTEARRAWDTVATLESCPRTADAVALGDLSLDQAREIVKAEAARPGSEGALLATARREGLHALRDEARKLRLAAIDAEGLHRRQHAARHVRHWRDDLGMVAGTFALAPEVGVPFVNRLDAETDRLRRRAKREDRLEARECHAADAFVAMLEGKGTGRATRADVVVVADVRALRRGHAQEGEPVHIVGGGPIPVDVVRDLAQDAFVKAVLHDGVKVDTVAHLGRHIPAELRTAWTWAHHPTSRACAASRRAAGAGTGSSGTTSSPWPTGARRPTPT